MSEKKITVQCCVPSCHKTNHSEPQILFFPFPKKREMQERWLHAIHRPELISILPKDKPFHMFICLEHFKKSDIVSVGGRTCLKAGVVPSVFSWKEEEKKVEPSDFMDRRSKALGLDKDVVTVTCGGLEAELYKEKFYCPGIHRECILYNNQFITPKMFMIMGDKERLKDWKNAVRIQGVKIRKFIENRQLDFYRHQEFCTGRCVARLPVNLFRTKTQPPDKWVNTSGDISNVKFHKKDIRPENYQAPDSGAILDQDEIKMEYNVDSDDSMVDEKPDVEILNALLKNPIPKTMTQGSASGFGITDNQVFWRGVIKLGLMDRCFDVILSHIQTLQTDLVLQNVRQQDAHELSAIVREMGLSNKLQHLLASCKQDMDKDCDKLDQQVEELKQKVTDFENRKKILKKRSEEFKEILKLNTPKASTSNPGGSSEDSDLEEPEVHFGPTQTSPAQVQVPVTKRSISPKSDAEGEVATKKIKISNNSILKVYVNETPLEKSSDSVQECPKSDEVLPKIVSVSSVGSPAKEEDTDRPMPTLIRSDGQPLDGSLTSDTSEKLVDVSPVKTSDLKMSLIADHKDGDTGDRKKENVRTVLWVKANGTSEYITLSNNSETKPVDDIEAVTRKSQSLSPVSQSKAAIDIPSQSSRSSSSVDEPIAATETPSQLEFPVDKQHEEKVEEETKTNQSETVTDVTAHSDCQSKTVLDVKAGGEDSQSEAVSAVKAGDDSQSEKVSDIKVGSDSQSERASDIKVGSDSQSERASDIKVGDDSQSERASDIKAGGDGQTETNTSKLETKRDDRTKDMKGLEMSPSSAKNQNLSPVKKSPRSVSPLFGNEVFGDFVAARRSSRRRTAKVKEDL